MNSYPGELLNHHYACMVVAGLNAAAPMPEEHPAAVFPELAQSLHDILAARGSNVVWDPARGQSAVFHTVFASSSTIRLPPHKTKPSARHVAAAFSSETDAALSSQASTAFAALAPRSPLSPLHPNSALFPDGLIAPIWVRKHTELIPAVFVAFYTLRPNSEDADGEALPKADQELIQVISERKRTLTERGIKLTVVLLAQREMLQDTQLEARLSYLRRSSGLDSRASLFVLTPVSRAELGEFVTSLHSALFESAVDYYREHARRVKRKRARYPPPQSTLASISHAMSTFTPSTSLQWLSREGWIVRSEYKLAVFAELQGDNAEALLRYKEAYDLLCMSPSCLLGSTLMLPPRSKRWAEAKVLADTLVIKICKLHLYNDQGDAVLPFFRRHLARFTDLSTGWGIGAMTFEYWSWLAKQYRMLGELIEQATKVVPGSPLPPFELQQHAPPLPAKLLHPDSLAMFATPESSAKGSLLPSLPIGMLTPNQNAISSGILPFSTLQNPGAYFYLAAICTMERKARYLRALQLTTTIDGPLAHEHKFDHTAQTVDHLTKAYDFYKHNKLERTALLVAARLASTYSDAQNHALALKFLERILHSYSRSSSPNGGPTSTSRRGGDDDDDAIYTSLVSMAAECAVQCDDVAAALRIVIPLIASSRGSAATLDALQALISKPAESDTSDSLPVVKLAYGPSDSNVFVVQTVFPVSETECGAPIPFQIQIRNTSTVDLGFLGLNTITLYFHGSDVFAPVRVAFANLNSTKSVNVIDLGTLHSSSDAHTPTSIETDAAVWRAHSILAFQGSLVAKTAGHVEIARIVLSTVRAETSISPSLELEFTLADPFEGQEGGKTPYDALRPADWFLPRGAFVTVTQRATPGLTLVRPRSFAVTLDGPDQDECYYVDQRIALTLTVRNDEASDALECWLDADLQPTYEGASDDRLSLSPIPSPEANEESITTDSPQQSVRELDVGVVQPGQSQEVKLWFTPARKAGLRTLDITLHVRLPSASHTSNADSAHAHVVKQSFPLEVTSPFDVVMQMYRVHEQASPDTEGGRTGLVAELFGSATESDGVAAAGKSAKTGAMRVETQIGMVGRTPVRVSTIRSTSPTLLDSTANAGNVTGIWTAGDQFSMQHTWNVHADNATSALEIVWTLDKSAADGADGLQHVTRIPLSLSASLPDSDAMPAAESRQTVTMTLSHSPSMTLQRASELTFAVVNRASSSNYVGGKTAADVAARVVGVELTIDSSENFAFTGPRRWSIPHLVPQYSDDAGQDVWEEGARMGTARIMPLKIGLVRLPTFSVRVSLPSRTNDSTPSAIVVSTANLLPPTQPLSDTLDVRLVYNTVHPETSRVLSSTTLYPPPSLPQNIALAPLTVHVRPLPP